MANTDHPNVVLFMTDQQDARGVPLPAQAHGATLNSWIGGPWHLEERLNFTYWVTDNALCFLEQCDPT